MLIASTRALSPRNIERGWRRGTYRRKSGLKEIAHKVDYRAKEWGAQLQRCEDDLDNGWWIF